MDERSAILPAARGAAPGRPGAFATAPVRRGPTAAAVPATRGELATLWVDGPHAVFNVALLCRFDAGPFAGSDGGVDTEKVRADVARRAAEVRLLRRRLTSGRRPAWIESRLRPADHVHCAELPGAADLLAWCARRIVEPLPTGLPLWRIDVIGLPDREFALLLVAHHVLADGRRGAETLRALLDPPPDEDQRPVARRPTAPPGHASRWERLREAAADLHARAPITSLSRPVGDRRRLAEVHADLSDLHAAAAAFGATVNDVLLAAATAGLRELLLGRGELEPGLTLRASVPMSSGGAGQPEGMLLVDMPVGDADPLHRLALITADTSAQKRRVRSGGGNVFDVLRLPTPLAHAAVRGLRHIAARGINLFVTDIPGPAEPMFLSGARMLSAVPVAPLTANVPLGVAALSYAGGLHIGVNADDAVTDLGVLTDAMDREFAILTAACSGQTSDTVR
jgi:diacylglycerol O-acyltransferase / wax synthase